MIDTKKEVSSTRHVDVINFLVKKRKCEGSFIYDITVPPKPVPFSARKKSLQYKIDKRKSKSEYKLPDDEKALEKLLKDMKETERIIRQDKGFFWKIREKKKDIQLEKIESNRVEQKVKRNSRVYKKHGGFYMTPKEVPTNSILI